VPEASLRAPASAFLSLPLVGRVAGRRPVGWGVSERAQNTFQYTSQIGINIRISASITTREPNETKSTMMWPIGACRLKWKPSAFISRSFTHGLTSCGVRRLRSARAFSFAKAAPTRPAFGRPPSPREAMLRGGGIRKICIGPCERSEMREQTPPRSVVDFSLVADKHRIQLASKFQGKTTDSRRGRFKITGRRERDPAGWRPAKRASPRSIPG
jgi:hypothetical protein